MKLYVFHENQLYGEYNNWYCMRIYGVPPISDDIYQKGYVLSRENNPGIDWYRCDGTPVLIEDVPKPLRMLALILNL